MFSRALHKENAHNDCIWSCDWGRFRQQPQTTEGGFTFHLLTCFKRILGWTLNNWLGNGSNSSWLDAVGSPPPAGDPEELIVTGGIDDVVKIWRYRFLSFDCLCNPFHCDHQRRWTECKAWAKGPQPWCGLRHSQLGWIQACLKVGVGLCIGEWCLSTLKQNGGQVLYCIK